MCNLQLLIPEINEKKKHHKNQQAPVFMAEPMRASNSFVGTEEYIAPVSVFCNCGFLLCFLFLLCLWGSVSKLLESSS